MLTRWICFVLTFSAATAALGQVPPYLVTQGRIVDASDEALEGDHDIQFAIFDLAVTDGSETLLWAEVQTVSFAAGYYTATLGEGTALDPDVFDGLARYLEIMVVAEGEPLLPRLAINSVAYAIRSGVADNATGNITPNSVSVGGATVIDDTGAWVGGLPTPDYAGAVTNGDLAAVATSGSYADLQGAPTTLSDVESACFDGEVVSYTAGAFQCISPTDSDTTYSAGFGLALNGTSFEAETAVLQARVVGTCSAGQMMTAIGEDGTVTCAPDVSATYTAGAGIDITGGSISLIDPIDDDTTYSAGAGIDITGGSISLIDTIDDDTTYSAGAGIDITGGSISLIDPIDDDTTYSAGAGIDITGGSISLIDPIDDDTTYSAGAGIDITGGSISLIDPIDDDTTYSAGAGIDITGGSISLIDPIDDDTTYTAGTGISITGTTISVSCPTGMAAIGRTCIHMATPYAQGLDWWSAIDTCIADGFRLCSQGEVVNALRAGVLLEYAFATGDRWYTTASQAEAAVSQAGENTTCDVQANIDQPSHPRYSVQCGHDKSWTDAWRTTVCCY